MSRGRYPLIVFDWDGTLMDSTLKIVTCFQAAAHDCGFPEPARALVERQIGLSLQQAWSNIFVAQKLEQRADALEAAVKRYRDYFLEIDQTPMPFYSGVIEGIRALDAAGYLLTIATGKARVGLQRALSDTDLQKHFVYSRCADETFSKPHPQMLLDILDYCGCEAHQALMIGDTSYDMQMASNAEVDSLAVSYGVSSHAELEPLSTRGCAANFPEVLEVILQSKQG